MHRRDLFTRRHNAIAAGALVLLATACASSEPPDETSSAAADAPPPPPSRVALPAADTAALKRVFWDLAGVRLALQAHGLASTPIGAAFDDLGIGRGVALAVGPAEVHVVFFGDIAAADRAARALDLQRVIQRRGETSRDGVTAFINNNMLAVVFPAGDPAVRARIVAALGPRDETLLPEDAEP